jgi:polyisoprenoid-binding protein YceI
MFIGRRCAEQVKGKWPLRFVILGAILGLLACSPLLAQPELRLEFTPANTTVNFELGDILHTVHGTFKLQRGHVDYAFATGAVHGELMIDATSGDSGNHSRDHKMHKEILESDKYPEIVFRPDRVQGSVAATGTSNVQVHGMFSIHGADHEMTMPVRVEIFPDHWVADTHFTIPYVKWGIKNPSTLFLRVSESVEIDIRATGTSPFPGGGH